MASKAFGAATGWIDFLAKPNANGTIVSKSMSISKIKARYDAVILGAGHNGLVAAAYLAKAGLSVLVLEKNDYVGGATTSQRIFADYDAWLSRYSYLVSLLPGKIIRDLGLSLELRRRAIGSFTPYVKARQHDGLLLSNVNEAVSRQSIADLTGSEAEFDRLQKFYHLARIFAEHVWDSMLEPLAAKEEFRRRFDVDDASREAWRSLAEEPLGRVVERYLQSDLVRGLVFTDAKIGIFTHPHDPSLVQNRCFLYHVIGNRHRRMARAGWWNGRCGARAGGGGTQRGRGDSHECRSSRAAFERTGNRLSIFRIDGQRQTVRCDISW